MHPEGPARRLAKMIDHTLLTPEASYADVEQLCREAIEHGFAAVCVNGAHVRRVGEWLDGSDVKTAAVVGFPFGASAASVKAFETQVAVGDGATEIDVVINLGALKSGDHRTVLEDLRAVVGAASDIPVKVILEASRLERDEKLIACALAKAAGAAFVKTSTGFGGGGATAEDVALMRAAVGPQIGVKASGGIRDWSTAMRMVDAGANRIGASASVAILAGAPAGGAPGERASASPGAADPKP